MYGSTTHLLVKGEKENQKKRMEGFFRKDTAWNDRPIPSTDSMQLPQLRGARESPGDRRGWVGWLLFPGMLMAKSWRGREGASTPYSVVMAVLVLVLVLIFVFEFFEFGGFFFLLVRQSCCDSRGNGACPDCWNAGTETQESEDYRIRDRDGWMDRSWVTRVSR